MLVVSAVSVNSLLAIVLVSSLINFIFIWKFDLIQVGWYKRSGDNSAVQAAHARPTPRLAGIGFVVAVLTAHGLVFDTYQHSFVALSLAIVPIFIAGLIEDFGYPMRPRIRLLATFISSALMIGITGKWISGVGVPFFDMGLEVMIVGIVFTILSVSAVTQAFNLIDGLNGFAGTIAFCTALGLGLIATAENESVLAAISLVTCAAVFGFLLLNYPSGRIFLGDAGAYTVGFVLAWIATLLIVRVDFPIVFSILLILFWPVADLLLTIYRRWRRALPISHPDRLHFHQLVMRALELLLFSRGSRHISNPVATAVMAPFFISPIVAGVILWDNPRAAFIALVIFSVLFVSSYSIGMALASRRFFSTSNFSRHIKRRMKQRLGEKPDDQPSSATFSSGEP